MKYFITAPNSPELYWRSESRGYTRNVAEAGVYEEREARSIEKMNRGDMLVPLDEAMQKSLQSEIHTRTVDISKLREENRDLKQLLKKLKGSK